MKHSDFHIESIVRNTITQVDTPLLLTISGGADSMSLFHICRRINANFIVAHCNFHLRGDESNRDEKFVRDICKKYNIECLVKDFDVHSYCNKNYVSEEMACRELRYAWFRNLKAKLNASRILTAHNADDNIETILLNLFRGTGIEGLKGMSTDNGEILRPLLEVSRKEIEQYLQYINETYITDSTNLESNFKRNFIRNILLPQVEKRWGGVRKSLHQTIQNISGAYAFYDAKVRELLPDNLFFLPFETIKSAPNSATLIYEFLKPYGANSTIVNEINTSINTFNCIGKKWILDDHIAIIEREGISIINPNKKHPSPHIQVEEINCNEQIMLTIKNNKNHNIIYLPGNYSDYTIRKVKNGDRIRPLGMNGSQLVSDIIKDAKLNNINKQNTWILEEKNSGEVIWNIGLKRSRYCLVNETDNKIIRLTANNN